MKKTTRVLSALIPATLLLTAACGSDEPQTPVNPQPGPGASGTVAPAGTSVIYQANPRMFASQKCLEALRAELPRIASMGCDVLWIMPVNDPGQDKSVGSPYCIRDFKKVNPRYGDMDDMKALVAEAHSLGMKVILDWVANHTAWDHPWIKSNPERYAKDAAGNIKQASTWTDVAQLDYSQSSTAEAMKDAMLFWVETAGIDGFRCDYAEGVPHGFWQDAIREVRRVRPDALMLAETSRTDFYADGFDMVYDWNYAPAMSKTFTGGTPASLFDKAAESLTKVPEGKQILRYAFNHDVAAENPVDTWFGSPQGTVAAYTLTAMLGGVPMIYSSMDAEGVRGKQSFFDYRPLSFSDDLTAKYKAVNEAYRATADLRGGKLATYADKDVACFTRTAGDHTLLVMVNTTGGEATMRTPITLSGDMMTDLLDGAEVRLPASVTLPAYGYIIYKK
ncbi:MAG: alpha-glucosidase C-terminal domain-containing protein [Muribaculaceae bacterium]|nr:alpha-glucosidase C-terminal domain-containing protein [Muribaculaceae bacterium]